MLGMPTVEARIVTRGRGGFLAARLWDVHRGRQVLVSRGVYRLRDNQRGRLLFQLFGNGWRFAKGHVGEAGAARAATPTSCARATSSSPLRSRRHAVDLPGR